MSRNSLYSTDPRVLFRETFSSESIARNGGVITGGGANTHNFTDSADFYLGYRSVGEHYIDGSLPMFRVYKGKSLSATEAMLNYTYAKSRNWV